MREEDLIILLVIVAYVLQAVIGGLIARRRGKSILPTNRTGSGI